VDGCTGGEVHPKRSFKDKFWLKPLDETIKIIDFGGATYDDE